MGDYDDLASGSERKAMTIFLNQAHDDTVKTIDELFKERTKKFYEEIKFMKGKIIGLIEGNHHGELTTGITTTQLLAEHLGCKYLGVSSLIRLSFRMANRNSSRAKIDIWAHHGRGASRATGGSLNSVEQMAMVGEADIFLMGHDHRKSVALRNKICLTSGEKLDITHKKILMGRTGSFLRGYVPGEPSYVAQAMLTPTDLGVIKIELTPKRIRSRITNEDCFFCDVHASL
jgi:predicted phosphodiesterase